jgi:hypothetical protein
MFLLSDSALLRTYSVDIFIEVILIKTKDMASITALNIADMRNVSEELCTRFRRSRGLNLHPASASVTFPHYDNLVIRHTKAMPGSMK